MDFLNDLEKELVESFYKNETQREAVRKVLLAGIYTNGTLKAGQKPNPTKNWALSLALDPQASDQAIGSNLRAVAEGIRVVELAFNELAKFKKEEKITSKPNKAR